MTWREFQLWAHRRFGFTITGSWQGGRGSPVYRAAWSERMGADLGPGTGSGNGAEYGPAQRRRVACYARMARHLSPKRLSYWLEAAALYEAGYLMDDGSGLRWVPDLEPIRAAYEAGRAVAAVRCGE